MEIEMDPVVRALQRYGVYAIAGMFVGDAPGSSSPPGQLRARGSEARRFLDLESHILAVRPDLLHQQALNQVVSPAIARAAAVLISSGDTPVPHIRWLNKPDRDWRPALIRTLRCGSDVHSVCFTADGRHVLTGTWSDGVRIWDSSTGELVRTAANLGSPLVYLAISEDGEFVVSGGWCDREVIAWRFADGEVLARIELAWDPYAIAFVPGTDLVLIAAGSTALLEVESTPVSAKYVSAGESGALLLWDVRNDEPEILYRTDEPLSCMAVARSGVFAVTADGSGRLHLLNLHARRITALLDAGVGRPYSLALSEDGRYVAVSGELSEIRVWNVQTLRLHTRLTVHDRWIQGLCFTPRGDRVLGCAPHGAVRIWELPSGRELAVLEGHGDSVHELAMHPNGRLIASGSSDRSARLWDLDRALQAREHAPGPRTGRAMSVSALGGRVVLAGAGARVHRLESELRNERVRAWIDLWTIEPVQRLRRLIAPRPGLTRIGLVRRGELIAGGFDEGYVAVWDWDTGGLRRLVRAHDDAVLALAGSPVGDGFATGDREGRVQLWKAGDHGAPSLLRGYAGAVLNLAFDPEGSLLVAVNEAGRLTLWDAGTCRLIRSFELDPRLSTAVPMGDGVHAIAAVGPDLILIDLEKGEITWRSETDDPTGGILSMGVLPGGRHVALATCDDEVHVYDIHTREQVAYFPGPAGINDMVITETGLMVCAPGFGQPFSVLEFADAGSREDPETQ
jgi:WD40 repeat protein